MRDRCDLCNSTENVHWVWLTPREVETEQEARDESKFWCEDPEWAVCDLCHSIIVRDKKDALYMRMQMSVQTLTFLQYSPEQEVWDLMDKNAHVALICGVFWAHKTEFWLASDERRA